MNLAGRLESVFSTVALALVGLASCATAPPMRVASDLANPPFAWVDEDGTPRGRDVTMMEWLADRVGRQLVWERMPFDELLTALEDGRADVVCATLGITPERALRVDFTRPYFETELAIVVPAGSAASVADLEGRRVGAGAGTTSERAVRSKLPGAVGVFENKTGAGTAERLARGELDAAVMDAPAAAAMVAESEGRLERLDVVLDAERYALALARGQPELLAALDAALREAHRSGLGDAWNEEFGASP